MTDKRLIQYIESLLRVSLRETLDAVASKGAVKGGEAVAFGPESLVPTAPFTPSGIVFIADYLSAGSTNVMIARDSTGTWQRLNSAKVSAHLGVTVSNIQKGRYSWTNGVDKSAVIAGTFNSTKIAAAWDTIYDAAAEMGMVDVVGACHRGGTLIVVGFVDPSFITPRPLVIRYSDDPLVNKASFWPGERFVIQPSYIGGPDYVSINKSASKGIFSYKNNNNDLGGIVRIDFTDTTASFSVEPVNYAGLGKVDGVVESTFTNMIGISWPSSHLDIPFVWHGDQDVNYFDLPDMANGVVGAGFVEDTEVLARIDMVGTVDYFYTIDHDSTTPSFSTYTVPYPTASMEGIPDPFNCYDAQYRYDWFSNMTKTVNLTSPTVSITFNAQQVANWEVYPTNAWDGGGSHSGHMYELLGGFASFGCGERHPNLFSNPVMESEVILAYDVLTLQILTASCDRSTFNGETSVELNKYDNGVKTVLETYADGNPGGLIDWTPSPSNGVNGTILTLHGGYINGVRDNLTFWSYDMDGVIQHVENTLTGGDFAAVTGIPADSNMSNGAVFLVDPAQIDNLV